MTDDCIDEDRDGTAVMARSHQRVRWEIIRYGSSSRMQLTRNQKQSCHTALGVCTA